MCEGKNFQSMFSWIICFLWWISCYESTSFENLRQNNGDRCMSELVSADLLSDDQFTASSFLNNKNIFQPSMARLLDIHSQSSPSDGRAWCPTSQVYKDLNEWIQVDFRRMTLLRAVYTMGRGDGNFKKFSPEIVIQYQRAESGSWLTYHDVQNETIIPINTDARTKLRTRLQTIIVKKIRIYPLDTRFGPKYVCLKIAFLGCYFDDEVVSYSSPQGDHESTMNHVINLRDEKYDGQRSYVLQNGLGLLMDNLIYTKPFQIEDFINKDVNIGFTGWKCTEERRKKPITIKFYYEQERIFNQISIYFVKSVVYNMMLTYPIIISIGYDNDTHHSIHNNTLLELNTFSISDNLIRIPLNQQKGTICTLNITCGLENWIVLHEVEIKSTKSSVNIQPDDTSFITRVHLDTSLDKYLTSPVPDYHSKETLWKKKDVSFLLAIGLTILLLAILLSCVAFLFYNVKKLRKHKLNKKLELVTKCNDRSLGDPSSRTVFTIQSKHPSMSSIARPNYFTDPQPAMTYTYNGSQPNDAIYASWPNTDEDVDVPNVDKEEEKCLLGTDINDNKSIGKEYAIYQPGVNFTGNDYLLNSRPSSTMVSLQNNISLSNKIPLSVSNLKIVSSNNLPMSTPIITYRNSKNVISYQHLINYGGICGDVDLRYQSPSIRFDNQGLDSNIKVVSATSLVFIQPWVRGQYGCVDLVTVALDNNDTCHYFMKKLCPDSPVSIKAKFILDLKILSTLNISTLAGLTAIVVEGDLLPNDVSNMIRSAKFSLLIDHDGGYNLKDFLRNVYYPQQPQSYNRSATLQSQGQINASSMLLILTQISRGLRHLEELGLTHRDVGCRNCVIDSKRQIKLYPGGYVTTQPFEDYCSIDLQNNIINFPLRWLAPESISKGLFTSKSDVWSFGVTMWEVFTLCSFVPYPSLSNEALLELMSDRDNLPRLPCPQSCPREIYDLMAQCWSWEESMRPTFMDINLFLQIKTTGPTNQAQFILPAPPPLITEN